VNYLVYTRGSSDDFDRYARVSGDSGWSWNALKPYIAKVCRPLLRISHHLTSTSVE
jgi:choline dehydrogenase-like flavoprotein